jgi:hypothetical protein
MIRVARLGRKRAPFRAIVTRAGTHVTLRNTGHTAANVAFAVSLVACVSAAGMWIATHSIMPSFAADDIMVLAIISVVSLGFGLWFHRYYEEVAIDWEAGRLRYRIRGWFRTTDIQLTTTHCQIRLHRIRLSRRRLLDWRGFALCIWSNGELLFPVCIVKKREVCHEMLESMRGNSEAIAFDYGDEILSRMLW